MLGCGAAYQDSRHSMHLYLIRHGESYINIPAEGSRSRDELDAGLTDKGQRQAQAVAKWMKQ